MMLKPKIACSDCVRVHNQPTYLRSTLRLEIVPFEQDWNLRKQQFRVLGPAYLLRTASVGWA